MAAKTPRECALAALERCRRDGAWSESALDSAVKAAQLDARDAALCTSLCATVLQNTAAKWVLREGAWRMSCGWPQS